MSHIDYFSIRRLLPMHFRDVHFRDVNFRDVYKKSMKC